MLLLRITVPTVLVILIAVSAVLIYEKVGGRGRGGGGGGVELCVHRDWEGRRWDAAPGSVRWGACLQEGREMEGKWMGCWVLASVCCVPRWTSELHDSWLNSRADVVTLDSS